MIDHPGRGPDCHAAPGVVCACPACRFEHSAAGLVWRLLAFEDGVQDASDWRSLIADARLYLGRKDDHGR